LAQALKKTGYGKVYYLKGGWDDWVKAGYPVDPR
jgi:rhodanese-related sulfurtransferase